MGLSTDIAGYAALAPGTLSEVLFPLLVGSKGYYGEEPDVPPLASGNGQEINYATTACLPYLYLKTFLYPHWLNTDVLTPMFLRDSLGALASWGAVQWRYGDQPARLWAASKVEALALSWGPVGTPVLAEMIVLPYGYAVNPIDLVTDPAGLLDRPFASQDVRYGGTLDSVWEGKLEIHNRLSPEISSPVLTSADGFPYANNYNSDGIRLDLKVTQTTGASLILSNESTLPLVFNDPTRTYSVTFTSHLIGPKIEEEVRGKVAVVARTYRGIAPEADSYIFNVS
jgi:hypothetical protein